ncbi:MAG: hypothetical protein WCK09_00995 [Bacteroidota bacterium]
MKKNFKIFVLLGFLLTFPNLYTFCQVSISTNGSVADPSAGLDVNFNNKGLLPPRMTFEQRNAIPNPVEGLMVFCTNCNSDGTGLLSMYQGGKWKNFSWGCTTPVTPLVGTHVPDATQVIWNWNTVPIAQGYKWNTANNFASAMDMGSATTKTETGLTCLTSYTRYVWAYNDCGQSGTLNMTQATLSIPLANPPVEGTHVATASQIIWNWNTVAGATGYKWNTANNYANATNMGTATSKTETSLTCNTGYIRYVWAYNACGNSTATTLMQTTSINPIPPVAGTNVPAANQIIWNWNTVTGATGYKWNTLDDYSTATNMGTALTKTETGLNCSTLYTRYVWAYNGCGYSTPVTLAQSTIGSIPTSPVAGTNVPSPNQIVWNWNTVSGATGYKWNTVDDYASATNMGTAVTKTETGLTCSTLYSRYVWAYNSCGYSTPVTLAQSTIGSIPTSPVAGTNVPSPNQIVWNWNTVSGATGYKWNTVDDYASATNMGTAVTKTETGLTCSTLYSRYVWAYNSCGYSTSVTLAQSTIGSVPVSPQAGTHIPYDIQINWNWNTVIGATGYKWNSVDDYLTATDMGSVSTKPQPGLTCNTPYASYVWAYNTCGNSTSLVLNQTTATCTYTCGTSMLHITHVAGVVAPVDKTVNYGTTTNIPGEPTKCWITQNLGASQQATVVSDTTEASAGWYWKFNLNQG